MNGFQVSDWGLRIWDFGKVAPYGRSFLDFAFGSHLHQGRLFTVVKGELQAE